MQTKLGIVIGFRGAKVHRAVPLRNVHLNAHSTRMYDSIIDYSTNFRILLLVKGKFNSK